MRHGIRQESLAFTRGAVDSRSKLQSREGSYQADMVLCLFSHVGGVGGGVADLPIPKTLVSTP